MKAGIFGPPCKWFCLTQRMMVFSCCLAPLWAVLPVITALWAVGPFSPRVKGQMRNSIAFPSSWHLFLPARKSVSLGILFSLWPPPGCWCQDTLEGRWSISLGQLKVVEKRHAGGQDSTRGQHRARADKSWNVYSLVLGLFRDDLCSSVFKASS